ncbi:MAG TPA: PASTA domain-containing protein [Gaiellaceae bacterium]|nr:PASTA domain-containing protein [Gaiellaceae bacterium]
MATPPGRPLGDDPLDDPPEEVTRADEEWPVAREYLAAPPPPPTAEAPPPAETAAGASRRRRFPPDAHPLLVLALLALLLALPLGAWLAARDGEPAGSGSPSPEPAAGATARTTTEETTSEGATTEASAPAEVRVPDVSGSELAAARQALAAAGLRVRVRFRESEEQEDVVLGQVPQAGGRIPRRSVVVLTVARAEERVRVPDVVGARLDEARRVLEEAGLRAEARRVGSEEPEGRVLRQSPAGGAEAERNAVLRLDVAEPPPTVAVPRLLGLTGPQAKLRLRQLGLRASVTRVESKEPEATVLRQSPPPGTRLRRGTTVRLTVSRGPSLIAVPDVTGLEVAGARAELEAAGLRASVVEEPTDDPAEDGLVLAQEPRAGARVARGTQVTLTVGRIG